MHTLHNTEFNPDPNRNRYANSLFQYHIGVAGNFQPFLSIETRCVAKPWDTADTGRYMNLFTEPRYNAGLYGLNPNLLAASNGAAKLSFYDDYRFVISNSSRTECLVAAETQLQRVWGMSYMRRIL